MVYRGDHTGEYARYSQYQPDITQAIVRLVLDEDPKYVVGDFNLPVYAPATIEYPTAPVDTRHNVTTLTSTVGNYTNILRIGDRMLVPFEWETQIADGSPMSLSWLVNGFVNPEQVDGGTGSELTVLEAHFERFGLSDQVWHNPTQVGDNLGKIPALVVPPGPSYAYLWSRGGSRIYFSSSGRIHESCVAPLDFRNLHLTQPATHGEDPDHAILWFGWRFYQRIEMNWGGNALTHRLDYWTYSPTDWDESLTNGPVRSQRSTAMYLKPLIWDVGKVIDLADMSELTLDEFAPTPGVDHYPRWNVGRNRYVYTTSAGVSQPPITRSASPYMAVIYTDTTPAGGGFSIAIAAKFNDPGPSASSFVEDEVTSNGFFELYAYERNNATGNINEPYSMNMGITSVAPRRRKGWIGSVQFIVIGRTADVMTELERLYTSGDLDNEPIQTLPSAVTEGTVFDRVASGLDAQPLSSIRSMCRLRWERSTV